MKITVKKNAIADVLSKIQGLAGRKSNLAITENVRIKTTDDGIVLTVTDLETGFEGTYPAQVESQGIIAINARKFYEIVRDFPSDDINIEEKENRWILIGNRTVEYHIVGMNAEDFPDIPQVEEIEFFEIESAVLKNMIEKTVMISGTSDDKRAHITGVFMERIIDGDQKTLRMVSTDGNRLNTCEHHFGTEDELPPGDALIIPKKGLHEVNKFLIHEGTVRMGVQESHFVIVKESETLIVRMLEGNFPAYKDIIKKEDGHHILVDRQLFMMTLKRMSILSSDTYKGVIFSFKEDLLLITSTNPDIGESKEDVEIKFSGDPIEVAFNPRYFIESLNAIQNENVIVNMVNDEKPCIIEGEQDKSFLSVIMPMKI